MIKTINHKVYLSPKVSTETTLVLRTTGAVHVNAPAISNTYDVAQLTLAVRINFDSLFN